VTDTDDLADRLHASLVAAGASADWVSGLRRLSGGASRETWAFDLGVGDGTHPAILQRTRRGTVGAMPMTLEAGLLRAAFAHGVPVPAVLGDGDESSPLGSGWMAVDRIEGETIARRILRDDDYAGARARLVGQAAEALAAVHRIPVDEAGPLPTGDPLRQMRALLDLIDEPHPALELGLRWLEREQPPAAERCVVHGDFRLGNLVVGPEGLRAVLDWELAHQGDPMEDLGWLCVRAWRFGVDAPVAGLGDYDELFTAYEQASGRAVDPAAVAWWEALGCLRWGAICMLQASSHLSGASRSVELAAIGRRTCEAEYDLLLLLGPDAPDPSDRLPDTGALLADAPHDRPTAAELVEAVREYLEADVLPATEGRVSFHARVAANVLAMVERQLAVGGGQARAHHERLAGLGVADDAALVADLRAGALDDRLAEVLPVVRASVVDKVSVANPGYLS
jgi:aminoglycoside phosphotransferase (APT) family kinase protein